jgi:hypothetical protein
MPNIEGYSSAPCSVCHTVMTNHRCLHPVKRGLIVLEVIGRVCGKPVCGPCNFRHGNKNVFRCPVHSVSDESSMQTSEEDDVAGKENIPVVAITSENPPAVVSSSKGGKVMARITKGSDYGAKDLLILSQAFIRTSENPVERTGQTHTKFWDEVAVAYSQLKKQQEAHDSCQRKRTKYNEVLLRGEFLTSDDEGGDEDIQVIIPVWTASSLQQKWSKFVQPLATKFITLTHRHPRKSGEGKLPSYVVLVFFVLLFTIFFSLFTDKDRYYNIIHLLLLDANPNVSYREQGCKEKGGRGENNR